MRMEQVKFGGLVVGVRLLAENHAEVNVLKSMVGLVVGPCASQHGPSVDDPHVGIVLIAPKLPWPNDPDFALVVDSGKV